MRKILIVLLFLPITFFGQRFQYRINVVISPQSQFVKFKNPYLIPSNSYRVFLAENPVHMFGGLYLFSPDIAIAGRHYLVSLENPVSYSDYTFKVKSYENTLFRDINNSKTKKEFTIYEVSSSVQLVGGYKLTGKTKSLVLLGGIGRTYYTNFTGSQHTMYGIVYNENNFSYSISGIGYMSDGKSFEIRATRRIFTEASGLDASFFRIFLYYRQELFRSFKLKRSKNNIYIPHE